MITMGTIRIIVILFLVIKYFTIIFLSIVLHEYAHGWVAYKLGDSTAKLAGRLTLNPLKHIDPVGTILVPFGLIILNFFGAPVFIFGWAKPVPVNFSNLRNPKKDMMLVGLAGPAINIILAIIFSCFLRFNIPFLGYDLFETAVFVNLLLASG